jgi:uncharacterized repeat protein (TIGR03803 family)
MRQVITCFTVFALAVCASAQSPSISQFFPFYCNSGYTFCPNGFQPALGPVQLSDGNFYGTTWYGSTSTGLGTVWQATPAGDINILYTFESNGSGQYLNGSYPSVSFEAGPEGKLYGVTLEGGAQGEGVFYSITPGGSQQVLYNFCSVAGCPDQAVPIVLASDGNFYGISFPTSTSSIIFRLTPQGAWSQFYTFPLGQLGEELVAGTDGTLYGVEAPTSFTKFKESVFRLTTAGEYTVLRTFPKGDRVNPLVQSAGGTLYGVSCCGTNTGVFEITTVGKYKMVQKTPEGAFQPSLLVPGSDGNLYGLIANGGNYDGQVFGIFAKKKDSFSETLNCADGCVPLSLTEGSDGNFYGLTAKGGTVSPGDNTDGTVFKVATGLKNR